MAVAAIDDIVDLIATGPLTDAAGVTTGSVSETDMMMLAGSAQAALEVPVSASIATRNIAFCYPDSPLIYPSSEHELDSRLDEATLVIQNLQVSVPALRRVCSAVAVRRRRLVTCSLYVSDPGSAGFDMHVDKWDVHIIQIAGRKRFWFTDPAPRAIESNVGTFLFIPEGVLHRADTVLRSVHLSFGTHRANT
jgi:hypothetical protein